MGRNEAQQLAAHTAGEGTEWKDLLKPTGGLSAIRGGKPKPTRLRLIHGSRGKVIPNNRQPKPPPELPSCPSHLLPTATAEWKRVARELYDLGIISRLNRAALAGYCQAHGQGVETEKKLQDTPAMLKMPSSFTQPNPWLTISNKQL